MSETQSATEPKKEPTVAELQAEIDQLKAQVKRLHVVLGQTGQQVIQLQLAQRQLSVNELDNKNRELQTAMGHHALSDGPRPVRPSSPVTEADLEELVGELHGQLVMIDDRNVRRIKNSRATRPEDVLVSIPNDDGVFKENFPQTLGEFAAMSDQQAFDHWMHFVQPPGVESLNDLLEGEEAETNAKVISEIYDGLAHTIGISPPTRTN